MTDRLRTDLDLLHRRILVLKAVEEHHPVGIIRLSKLLNYPHHKVRYALRILEQDGLIRPSQEGAVVTKRAKLFHEELRDLLDEMQVTIDRLKDYL